MTWMFGIRSWALLLAVGVGTACGSEAGEGSGAAAQPEAFADHECGACGMIVREQPAPRAQVVHRDGTHVWFCSIADVVAYLDAPSPHGRIEHVWVETLGADAAAVDLGSSERAAHPWLDASDAFYVLGVARPDVMGAPVLVFNTAAGAAAAATRFDARAASWTEVLSTLGVASPAHAGHEH